VSLLLEGGLDWKAMSLSGRLLPFTTRAKTAILKQPTKEIEPMFKVSKGVSLLCYALCVSFVPAGTLIMPRPASAQDYGAIVAAPDRSEEDRKTDERRKPAQFLPFTGVRPGIRALDFGAGGGYTTELLARAVGTSGVVFAQSTSKTPPRAQERFEARRKSLEGNKIVPLVQNFDHPLPLEARDLDLITFVLNYHDTAHMGVDRAAMNRNLFEALKPGGVFVVVDHAAKDNDGVQVAGTLHRIEERIVRSEIEAAGFRLIAEGNFLRNPGDSREATSERDPATDRFVLKFEKPL
jgi:predicted methyltransferase